MENANKDLPEDENIILKFCNSWMSQFQAHTGLKPKRVHGERSTTDLQGVSHALLTLRVKMQRFSRKNKLNS